MTGRWAVVIGVAAVGVMALGAQTAAAPGVHNYDTKLTITFDFRRLFHGEVKSKVHKCELRRRVVLFKERRGADRKLGADQSGPHGDWGIAASRRKSQHGDRVYAKVKRSGDGFVCRADRSETIRFPELGPSDLRNI
jgi:hypothetical protein